MNRPITNSFSAGEYADRLKNVRRLMTEYQLDALIVDQTEFMSYLTGFSVSENMYRACLIPTTGDPILIFRSIDMGPFLENSWLKQESAITFSDSEDPVQILANTIKKNGWQNARIGLDELSYCMPIRRYKNLTQMLPNVAFIDVSEKFQLLRTIKSETEVSFIHYASNIADEAMLELTTQLSNQEASPRKAADIVHQIYMEKGADSSRAGIITTGIGDDFLHGNLHDSPINDGEILHVELLPFYQGYSARLMRPYIRGRHLDKIKQAEDLIKIQDNQISQMKPGVKANVIDAIARKGLLDSNLRSEIPNITGYSLGYFPISTPHTSDFSRVFKPESEWTLEPGMTFHMYLSASGLAFSETVLVTEAGAEVLTRYPRKIHII